MIASKKHSSGSAPKRDASTNSSTSHTDESQSGKANTSVETVTDDVFAKDTRPAYNDQTNISDQILNDSTHDPAIANARDSHLLASDTNPPENSIVSCDSEKKTDVPSSTTIPTLVTEKPKEVDEPVAAALDHTDVVDEHLPAAGRELYQDRDTVEKVNEDSTQISTELDEGCVVANEISESSLDKKSEDHDQAAFSADSESFLEKSSISQQSPLSSSIFKALGIQEADASDLLSENNKHEEDELDGSYDTLEMKKEEEFTSHRKVTEEKLKDQHDSHPSSSVESDDEPTTYDVCCLFIKKYKR